MLTADCVLVSGDFGRSIDNCIGRVRGKLLGMVDGSLRECAGFEMINVMGG